MPDCVKCSVVGADLLNNARLNKGTAFTNEERSEFGLHGLLPSNVQTIDQQIERAYDQFKQESKSALRQNAFLNGLHFQNEVLFYKLLETHITEMLPIIYTPTEGKAIELYSKIFQRPEGCFLSIDQPLDTLEETMKRCAKQDHITYIVCSDGEEILGIGDQGVGGISISTAKSNLLVLCAGLHPHKILSVGLDCGTNNQDLLNDNTYLGLKKKRVRGKQYDEFIKAFVNSAKNAFPNVTIHFEDFGISNARRVLNEYREELCCFNDDIQGTGAVTLAAILAALHISKCKLKDSKIVIFGAGTAGTGIADAIVDAMIHDQSSKQDAISRIWLVDKQGVLYDDMSDDLTPAQKPYARDASEGKDDMKSLSDVIKKIKPNILIGCSTKKDSFDQNVCEQMAENHERPIILPLSNPTKLCEAEPKDVMKWTKGKALVATGSPYPPVENNDDNKIVISECNNALVYPGIALACILSKSSKLSNKMLYAAAVALAELSPAKEDESKGLLPDVEHVRSVSTHVAVAIIKQSVEEGLSKNENIPKGEDIKEWVEKNQWSPEYKKLVKE
ncbi:malate dehydrogenase [Acrasis kona]|uniref:Malic enzyme n=1 Tax=Acrasis kona TaxID=1008807 RepID=A0AAW2ZLG0_9EUKA